MNIRFNRALKSIKLGTNNIGDDGVVAISATLESNTTLTDIDLNGWNSNAKIGLAGAQAIAKMLEFDKALTSENLSGNNIGDEGTAALSNALKSNSTLEELELSESKIGAAGAQSLGNMLQFNRALNSVDLRNNGIPDAGKQQLRDAVKGKSTTLRL